MSARHGFTPLFHWVWALESRSNRSVMATISFQTSVATMISGAELFKEDDWLPGGDGRTFSVRSFMFWTPLGAYPVEECMRYHASMKLCHLRSHPPPPPTAPPLTLYHGHPTRPVPLLACILPPDRSLFRAPTCPLYAVVQAKQTSEGSRENECRAYDRRSRFLYRPHRTSDHSVSHLSRSRPMAVRSGISIGHA